MNVLSIFFPGVWVHEFAHALACWMGGVKVHRVNVRSSSGVVVHDPTNARNAWVIALAPLVIGTGVGMLCLLAAKNAWETHAVLAFVLGWLGISIGFHAIPSTTDALNIHQAISRRFWEAIRSSHSFSWKAIKIAGYAFTWPLAWASAGIIGLVNLSILFRAGWVIGMLVLAGFA